MKASEMTNEELAGSIESIVARRFFATYEEGCLLEAAKRLRALSALTTHTDNSEVIAELQRRLKVAEDALAFAWMYADKLPHQWPLPERVRTKMKNALAAIRGKGGAK